MFVARLTALLFLLYVTLGQRLTVSAPTGGRGTISPLELAFAVAGATLGLRMGKTWWDSDSESRRRALRSLLKWWGPTVGPLFLLLLLLPVAGVAFRGYQLRTVYGAMNVVAPVAMILLAAAPMLHTRDVRRTVFAAIVAHGTYGLGQMLFRVGVMPQALWGWAFRWDVRSEAAYSAKYVIYGRSTGLFINANDFGMWSLLAILFAMTYMERRMRTASVLLGVVGVVGSQSRTAWAALALLALGYLVVTLSTQRPLQRGTIYALIALPALAVVGALVEPDSVSRLSSGLKVLTQGSKADPNLALRYQEWSRALRFSIQYPFGTWGPPQVRFGSFIDSQYVNYYLQGGTVLILAYSMALLAPLWLWRRRFPNPGAFALMAAAVAVFSYAALPLDNPMVSAPVWAAVGLSAAAARRGAISDEGTTLPSLQSGPSAPAKALASSTQRSDARTVGATTAVHAAHQIVLLWLERAADGTAAGAHLRGTAARVRAMNQASLVQVIADRASPDGRENYVRKAVRLASLVLAGILSARPKRVLIARHHPFMLPVVLVWRAIGGKVILSIQGSLDDIGENEYRWLARASVVSAISVRAAKLAHGLIVGAPVLFDYVRDRMLKPGTPLVSIPNGVFLEDFGDARATTSPRDDDYVVFVGNLASWQGIETMVLATEDPAWPDALPLVVVGDGTERHRVLDHKRVVWLGRLPAAQAAVWLTHAYCALALKRSDTAVGSHGYWPFKLIESAAAGVPMICSDAKGMASAARELGHAVVVPAEDPAATAVAVRDLYRDRTRRAALAAAGVSSADRYSWEAGADALQGLLDAVLLAGSPAASSHREW